MQRSAKVITTTTTTMQNEGNGNGKIKLISFCILHPSSFLDTFVSCIPVHFVPFCCISCPFTFVCYQFWNKHSHKTNDTLGLSKEGTRVIVYSKYFVTNNDKHSKCSKYETPTPILKPETIQNSYFGMIFHADFRLSLLLLLISVFSLPFTMKFNFHFKLSFFPPFCSFIQNTLSHHSQISP